MSRWTALDWLVTLGPFVILTAVAWWAIRRGRAA